MAAPIMQLVLAAALVGAIGTLLYFGIDALRSRRPPDDDAPPS